MTRLDNALGFHENVLRLRSERQQLLASNIANADTPGYKAKDMDFQAAMKAAMLSQSNSAPVAQSHALNMALDSRSQSSAIFERQSQQNNMDGNSVDMDTERNAFTENALRYEVSISLAHEDIKNLLNVLQG